MAIPTKRVPDGLIAFGNAAPDVDPHVSAPSTGGFTLVYDFQSPPNVSVPFIWETADGFSSVGISLFDSPTSIESGASSYGLANGNVVVAWTDTPTATPPDSDIKAAVVNIGNFRKGATFVVNVGDLTGAQVSPEVVELTNSNLAFAWIDSQTGSIRAAVFDSFGIAFNTNVILSTTPSGNQGGLNLDLGLTPLGNSGFAVLWRDDNFAEHFRILGPSGSFVTGDITVPTASTAGPGDIIQLPDGTIEIISSTAGRVTGHAYDASGHSLSSEFIISSGFGEFPAATVLQDGRFMAVYDENGDIFGRIMNRDGTPSTAEFRINTNPTGTQTHATIDTMVDGQIAVAWEDSRTGAGDIYRTIFDPRESPVNLTGTNARDTFFGTDFNDTLTGGFGSDS